MWRKLRPAPGEVTDRRDRSGVSTAALDVGVRHSFDPGNGAGVVVGDIGPVGYAEKAVAETADIRGIEHPRASAPPDHRSAELVQAALGVGLPLRTAENDIPAAAAVIIARRLRLGGQSCGAGEGQSRNNRGNVDVFQDLPPFEHFGAMRHRRQAMKSPQGRLSKRDFRYLERDGMK